MRTTIAGVLVCLAVLSTISFLACSCDDECECNCCCYNCPAVSADKPSGVGVSDDDASPVDDDASPPDDDDNDNDDNDDNNDDGGPDLPSSLEYIDGGNYSGAALVLSATGRAGIVSSRGRRLLRFDEGPETWTSTMLHFGVDANPMAALDPDGTLHLVAYDWLEERLIHLAGPDWTPEVVDQDGRVGHYSAVAVGDDGIIHAAYIQEDALGQAIGLRYAYRDALGWHGETADAELGAGAFPTIALDAGGTPYVTYNTTEDVALARRTDKGWETRVLPESKPRGRAGGLGFDAAGTLHVIYHNEAAPDGLHYATGSFEELSVAAVPGAEGVGDTLAMTVDGAGVTHFVYFGSGAGSKYGHNAGGDWHIETLGSAEAVYVAANSTDEVAVSIGGLGVYRKTAGAWQTPRYFGHSFTVADTAVGLDADGLPPFVYLEGATRALRFARWSDGAWTSTVIVADIGEGADNAGFAVDAAGIPHVVYHHGWTASLNFADATDASGTAWNIEIIDDEGLPGTHCALAWDEAGNPHVSYYDEARGHLKYATRQGGVWEKQIVAAEGVTGAWSDISIDGAETPTIAYLDLSDHAIKLATGGDPWLLETIDAGGGDYVSLTHDAAGNPHVAYVTGVELRHAWRTEGIWHGQTADESANAAETDIAPFGDGVAIVYQSLGESLRLAVHTSTDRHTQTLDDVGACGGHAAMVAGETGLFIAEVALSSLWLATVNDR